MSKLPLSCSARSAGGLSAAVREAPDCESGASLLFAMLRDGITLADGSRVEGYALARFSVLVDEDGKQTPEQVIAAIRKAHSARPMDNLGWGEG